MYQAAIAQLTAAAETCEHNAPIHEAEGNVDQGALSRANAEDYRAAVDWLHSATQAVPVESKEGRVVDEEALRLLDKTALMLRGMTLNPAIPEHAKDAMRSSIERIENFVEERIE